MAEDQREQFSSTEDETQAEAGDETRVETFTIDGSEDETNELDNAETKTEDSEQPLINQEAVNKRINELTKEKYEERRKREALEARLTELERAKEKTAVEKEIEVPPMPDPYDPQFQALVAERDKAIEEKAKADAAKQSRAEEQKRLEQQKEQDIATRIQEQAKAMFDKGVEYGIKQEDLQQADKTVAMFVKDPSLAQFILSQDESALLVKHLASDISELEKISQMDVASSAAYIATQVLPKVGKMKPATPGAPDPLKVPRGKGGGEAQSPYLKNVTFE
jgi:hypothetical protein